VLLERVAAVAAILAEDGSFVITEHNCAVLAIAKKYQHACSSELAFLREALPDAEVTRVAHRLGGGHVCAYLVRPRPAAGTGAVFAE
jgi:DeoR family suf operon transcriptional repressor